MLPGPPLGEEGKLSLGFGLVLVDEDLDYVGVGHKLRHDQPRRGLVGAGLVDRLGARHPQGHHQLAAPLLDQDLGGDGEVLDPGDGVADDLGGAAPLKLLDGGPRHVVSGEVGVGDPDLHGRLMGLSGFNAYRRFCWPEKGGRERGVGGQGSEVARPSVADPASEAVGIGTGIGPGPAPLPQVEELVSRAVPVDGDTFTAEVVGLGEDIEDILDRRLRGEVDGLGDSVVGESLEGRLDFDVLGGGDLHRRDE